MSSEDDATRFFLDESNHLTFISDSELYYVNYEGSNITVSNNPTTVWTRTPYVDGEEYEEELSCVVNNTRYYLVSMNNNWIMFAKNQGYITDGKGNYLRLQEIIQTFLIQQI